MNEIEAPSPLDENKLIAERREKLRALRGQGVAFPNDFRPDAGAGDLQQDTDGVDAEALAAQARRVKIAGRLLGKRVMGKASFARIQDRTGSIQLFLQKDALGETYDAFKGWDVGDIVGAEGTLMRTRTGELSVRVDALRLLTKSLRPLPDKWHGLADVEQRYRQRYVDLIVTPEARDAFQKRSRIIGFIRQWLEAEPRRFMEVETPMMHVIPGGATARPFVTHHNALDIDLYLRVAPELYLKRLVVGGIERVYEINRNFRNEGVSTRHNPEFTMVEFYTAYAQFDHILSFVEEMISSIARTVCGDTNVFFGEQKLTFAAPFTRITMLDAVAAACAVTTDAISSDQGIRVVGKKQGVVCPAGASWGACLTFLFEELVEKKLVQPTFITQFPVEVSPLAKRSSLDPRF